jgi:hypothetical protein
MSTTRHVSTYIDRPVQEVYDYASDPTHLPEWAPGLLTAVERIDGQWIAESPMGRIVLGWTPRNGYGVLDHHVTVPSGETFYNPMRVTTCGEGSEVVFSVRRRPGLSDDDFDRDADAVLADLVTLKHRVEGR